ncbi:MAG: zinc ABC transporter substrate-binding protein [Chloroflexota bacterium]
MRKNLVWRTAIISLLVMLSGFLVACAATTSQDDGDISERKVRVVTTIGMIGDVAKNIGGDRVEVVSLMGPGVDPHLYKASEGDVGRLQEADIIFYCGLHLEAGMADVLERMAEGEIAVTVAVCEQLEENLLISSEDFGGSHDPHIWFDVNLWKIAARATLGSLNDLDPNHVEAYQANADSYMAMLDELETYVRTEIERVAPEQRVLVTAHDAFGYFGKAYGFEVLGLQGISTESEASTNDVQELADFIAEQQISAIFIESSVPRRTIEAVQAAVQARGFDVQIGGELFSDAMGDPDTVEGTYEGMVRHNVDTIVGALLGEVSE